LERRFSKSAEITRSNSHYAVQGHSRSPIVYTNRKFIYDFLLVINSNLITSYLAPFPSYGQIFASERKCLTFTLSLVVIPANIAVSHITSLKTRFYGLHFCRRKYRCIFDHFYVIRPESYRIR